MTCLLDLLSVPVHGELPVPLVAAAEGDPSRLRPLLEHVRRSLKLLKADGLLRCALAPCGYRDPTEDSLLPAR